MKRPTMATDRIELAIRAALASPKQGLAYVRALRRNAYMATMSTPELFALREILIRESSKPKAVRTLTSREREIFGALEDRRAAGELENGGKNLVDVEALRHFTRVSGFPSPGRYYLYLPDFDELVAADLLWRYGWSASEAGLAFDDWKTEHRLEMLEIMKQISAISGTPTPREARNDRGSCVQ